MLPGLSEGIKGQGCSCSSHSTASCHRTIPECGMDIVGPLPRTISGNRYILVLCDYATRNPEAVAVRSIDAECIADELVRISLGSGYPKKS